MGGPNYGAPQTDEQKPKENDPDEKAVDIPADASTAQAEEVKKPED